MDLTSPVSAPAIAHAASSSRLMETQSSRNEDWNTVQRVVLSLFQQKALGTPGPIDLYELNQKLLNLMKTEIAPFLGAYYQEQLLKRGMIVMREAVREETGQSLLDLLSEVWTRFYGSILPNLQATFYPLTTSPTSSGMSIRNMSLIGFRDIIVMKMPVKEAVESEGIVIPPAIKQMFLVLSMVKEKDHPTDTYLRLEDMVSHVVSPFLPTARLQKRIQEQRSKSSPKLTDKSGSPGQSYTLPRKMTSAVLERGSSSPSSPGTDGKSPKNRGMTFSSHSDQRGSFPLSAEQQLQRRQPARRRPTSTKSANSVNVLSDLGTLPEQQQQQQRNELASRTVTTANSVPVLDTQSSGDQFQTARHTTNVEAHAKAQRQDAASESSGENDSTEHFTTVVPAMPSSVQSTGSGGSGPEPKTPTSPPANSSSPEIGSISEDVVEGDIV